MLAVVWTLLVIASAAWLWTQRFVIAASASIVIEEAWRAMRNRDD